MAMVTGMATGMATDMEMKIKGSIYWPASGAILACLSTVAFAQSSISGAPSTHPLLDWLRALHLSFD